MINYLPSNIVNHIRELHLAYKSSLATLSHLRHERASLSQAIAQARAGSSSLSEEIATRASQLKKEINDLEFESQRTHLQLQELAQLLPNDTHPATPVGSAEKASIMQQWDGANGLLPKNPNRDHLVFSKWAKLIDLEAGAKVTGSSWIYLSNEACMLEQAIINYALSVAVKHGYGLVSTPDVIRSDFAFRCGYHPRELRDAQEQVYSLGPSNPDLVLSATAEIPLAGMYAMSLLNLTTGPIRMVASGKAFRTEAGARGRDSKGLYRVHQFSKVELYTIATRDDSDKEMSSMLEMQKEVIHGLGLPYRVLDMPTEELGAPAFRKYDIEVWMPGKGTWGEVSSLSNCTDYQARRLHIRHRCNEGEKETIQFVHTLNGTAAAIPRLLISLIENGLMFDEGKITGFQLPSVLKPFWLGRSTFTHLPDLSIHWV